MAQHPRHPPLLVRCQQGDQWLSLLSPHLSSCEREAWQVRECHLQTSERCSLLPSSNRRKHWRRMSWEIAEARISILRVSPKQSYLPIMFRTCRFRPDVKISWIIQYLATRILLICSSQASHKSRATRMSVRCTLSLQWVPILDLYKGR